MKIKIAVLMFLFLTVPALGQTSAETDEQKLKDLIKNSFQEIFSENKEETLSKYYTEDFLLLEDGEIWDLEIIRGYMERAAARDQNQERINSFDFREVKISGDMAWIAYFNKAIFKKEEKVVGEMNWLESATAIRTPEGWKLNMLHSTVIDKEKLQQPKD